MSKRVSNKKGPSRKVPARSRRTAARGRANARRNRLIREAKGRAKGFAYLFGSDA